MDTFEYATRQSPGGRLLYRWRQPTDRNERGGAAFIGYLAHPPDPRDPNTTVFFTFRSLVPLRSFFLLDFLAIWLLPHHELPLGLRPLMGKLRANVQNCLLARHALSFH